MSIPESWLSIITVEDGRIEVSSRHYAELRETIASPHPRLLELDVTSGSTVLLSSSRISHVYVQDKESYEEAIRMEEELKKFGKEIQNEINP